MLFNILPIIPVVSDPKSMMPSIRPDVRWQEFSKRIGFYNEISCRLNHNHVAHLNFIVVVFFLNSLHKTLFIPEEEEEKKRILYTVWYRLWSIRDVDIFQIYTCCSDGSSDFVCDMFKWWVPRNTKKNTSIYKKLVIKISNIILSLCI